MKQYGKKQNKEGQDYWQSIADMLAALLLVLLLIMMVLILYIVRVPEEELVDDVFGDTYADGENWNENVDMDRGWDINDSEWNQDGWHDGYDGGTDDGAGGGGGFDDGIGKGYDYPEQGHGEGMEKAAVYVMVYDAETRYLIREEGIVFELYSEKYIQQTLNTYYPVKVEYRDFETTENGTFYLPEKILIDGYYLREVTEPDGYDAAEDRYFYVDDGYDWPEPYTIRFYLQPSKNIIRIQMKDADTGGAVPGGVYDVIAAEEIKTLDGTVRYREGEVATQIVCGDSGYGESQELYLGEYLLKQSGIPEYYAGDEEPIEVSVEKRGTVLPAIHEIEAEKTTVTITLADELYGNIVLDNALFSLTREGNAGESENLFTDAYGEITLTDLNKNTTYHLRQLRTKAGYALDAEVHSFTVSSNGRVEEEAKSILPVLNRTLRASIGVKDILLQKQMSDYNVALYDGNDELVDVWDSTGLAHTVTGLEPGTYYVSLNGNRQLAHKIEVADVAEVQTYSYRVWTVTSVAIVFAVLAILTAVVLVIISSIRKKHSEEEGSNRV